MISYKIIALVCTAAMGISTINGMDGQGWQPRKMATVHSFLPPVKRSNPENATEAYDKAAKRLKQAPQSDIYEGANANFLALLPKEIRQELNKRLIVSYATLDLAHSMVQTHPIKDLIELAFLILFKNKDLKLAEKKALMESIRTKISQEVEKLEWIQDIDDTRIQLKKHIKIIEHFNEIVGTLLHIEQLSSPGLVASWDRPQSIPQDLHLYYAYESAASKARDRLVVEFLEQHGALEKEAEYKKFRPQSPNPDLYFIHSH